MVSRNAAGCLDRKSLICNSFSAANTEQVVYSRQPPGASSGQSAARMRCCWAANDATSLLRRSHLTSGWRRTTPDAVHGTSARMRSNGWPSHQPAGAPASPTAVRIDGPARRSRARFSRTRSIRPASLSTASRSTSASSATCEVLPPGAAHASSTRMPSRTPSSGAASCAPASCTENAPSANPGSSVTGRGVVTMRPAAPTGTVATPAAAIAAASASRVVARRLTRSVSGGRSLPTSRMRCQSCGWSASTRPIHQRGYDQRATGLAATTARVERRRARADSGAAAR